MLLRSCLRLGAVALSLAICVPAHAAPTTEYRLVKTVPMGAPDRWDYVVFDPASGRVFVAHSDRVTVVDGRSGRVLGQVEGTPGGSHGTSISVSTGQGFTDDGGAGEAVAFDLKTLTTLKRIPAAPDADGIVRDPPTGRVFVADGDSGKVTMIDPRADAAIGDLDLGGKLEGIDADGDGRIFVAGAEKREIAVIGAREGRILARYAIPACLSPHGVAADGSDHRLFVTCENSRMLVLDSASGATVATLPIGRGSDAAAWDPKRRRAFSPNGKDGTISVVQEVTPNHYKALPPIRTKPSARTMAVDPATGRLFVAAADVEAASAPRGRTSVKPGSLVLMMFDPR
jgi:DNA-binding beta-propeller fold protein YncE